MPTNHENPPPLEVRACYISVDGCSIESLSLDSTHLVDETPDFYGLYKRHSNMSLEHLNDFDTLEEALTARGALFLHPNPDPSPHGEQPMATPLEAPVTVRVHLETQEDVLALMLRVNLDPSNLRTWYHNYRNRPLVNVPDVRFSQLFRLCKQIATDEGFSMERAPEPDDDYEDDSDGEARVYDVTSNG